MSEVTICIPAYRAEAFLAETIESALAQTHPIMRLIVSVDGGDEGTVAAAERYADRGVSVIAQPTRLGWVGNTNAALAMVTTSHAMILPHDDRLDPHYVVACLKALDANPDTVLAYTDMRFGPLRRMRQNSIVGDRSARLETFLRDGFDAVAFRGVFDRSRAPRHLVPNFAVADYAADTLWLMRMLTQGGMVRVPRLLYRKYLLPTSVHAGWKRTSARELDEMWLVHCIELEQIAREDGTWDERLEAAWQHRLGRRLNRSRFRRRLPSMLGPARPMRHQAEAAYERVRERQPAYSWVRG